MALAPVDELEIIPEPYELLDMVDGQTVTLRPQSWDLGKCLIHPRDGRDPRWVPCLRVAIPAEDKATIPLYWDITSKHLIAGLLGYLESGPASRHSFKITKHGKPPMARFTLEAIPAA